MLNDFLVANGAAVRINDAGREHGQIRAFNFSGYEPTKTVPTVVLRNEDYGRIARLLALTTETDMLFRNLDGTRVVLRDGDRVMFGGYSPTGNEGMPPMEPWIVRPNASCPTEQWQAHEVRLVR